MSKLPIIWVLCDDRPGNYNQLLGICDFLDKKLQLKPLVKNIKYNKLSFIPSIFLGKSIIAIANKHEILKAPYPDFIITAGRRTIPIARYIKKQNNDKSKIIIFMKPPFMTEDMDLIFIPEHDEINIKDKRIIRTMGSPNRISYELLIKTKLEWGGRLPASDKKIIGILIGGGKYINQTDIDNLINIIENNKENYRFFISTSRRTDKKFASILKLNLPSDSILYDFNSGEKNPYYAILAFSDIIIGTGDSMSICSEISATGKPNYIYINERLPKKYNKFLENLINGHYSKNLLNNMVFEKENGNFNKLDTTNYVGNIVSNFIFSNKS